MVRSGLVTAWRLAGWPTRRSPSSVKATIEGVVRMPSAFSMTFGFLPSITATQELVVPRSMPMTLPMVCPLASGRSAGPLRHPDGTLANNRGALRPTPWIQVRHRPRGVLAHIGGRPWAARRKAANSPANGALPQALAVPGGRDRSALALDSIDSEGQPLQVRDR